MLPPPLAPPAGKRGELAPSVCDALGDENAGGDDGLRASRGVVSRRSRALMPTGTTPACSGQDSDSSSGFTDSDERYMPAVRSKVRERSTAAAEDKCAREGGRGVKRQVGL